MVGGVAIVGSVDAGARHDARSLCEDVVNLAQTRERGAVFVCSVCHSECINQDHWRVLKLSSQIPDRLTILITIAHDIEVSS